MKAINVAAGERVRVVRRMFSSVPMEYRFDARAAAPGQVLAGTVEVRKSWWIIPGPPAMLALQASNVVQAGFWDTFVSVDVVPAVDTIVSVHGRRIRHLAPLLLMALAVVVVAAAMLVMLRA